MAQSPSSSDAGGNRIVKSMGAATVGYTLAHGAAHVVAGTALTACTAACAPIALIGAALAWGIVYIASVDE